MSWQDQYERAADQERTLYNSMSVEDLLTQIEQERFGEYNMIWYALADRATLPQAGWKLFKVLLRDDFDYLLRCNCAEALLHLLGRDDVLEILNESVKLTSGTPIERMPYLTALQEELTNRLGAA